MMFTNFEKPFERKNPTYSQDTPSEKHYRNMHRIL